ncbi:methylated-DNA--[protein]-cysteine S-methyltransferase [Staphylococcus caprae]|uniref:methylated-DNA--[protein]-cysteine S-methyltransferase n=1 Tax=Staphylococcus caprae TaxID=29380 RepID=UPI003B211E1E
MQYQTTYQSPLGQLQLISDGTSLTHLLYPHQYEKNIDMKDDLPIFTSAKRWLDHYFNGDDPMIDFQLLPQGSNFQQEVWNELTTIKYGDLKTYGDIAKIVGRKLNKPKMSAQAVGGAVGSNPISIIIPCHRVVGKDGSLTGYGGTIDNKIKLLEIENVDMTKLYPPKHSTKP